MPEYLQSYLNHMGLGGPLGGGTVRLHSESGGFSNPSGWLHVQHTFTSHTLRAYALRMHVVSRRPAAASHQRTSSKQEARESYSKPTSTSSIEHYEQQTKDSREHTSDSANVNSQQQTIDTTFARYIQDMHNICAYTHTHAHLKPKKHCTYATPQNHYKCFARTLHRKLQLQHSPTRTHNIPTPSKSTACHSYTL